MRGMTLSSIVSRLQACRNSGAWERIAKRADVNYGTISRIVCGRLQNPGVLTCEKIERAMDAEGIPVAAQSAEPATAVAGEG
jgi:transcriptional regulator with XRE-family HTH domain